MENIKKLNKIFFLDLIIVILSCFSFVFLNYLIVKFIHPNTQSILNNIKDIIIPVQTLRFIPEPLEKIQYIATIFFAPIIIFSLIIIVYKLFENYTPSNKLLYSVFFSFLIITGVFFAYVFLKDYINNYIYIYNGFGNFSSKHFFLFGFFFYLFFICPLSYYLVFTRRKFLQFIFIFFLSITVIVVLISIFLMNIFNLGMIEHVKLFHFNPVYYPFTQIIQDKYLIIDTFSAYGLYPEFLRPIFNVIGLNVLKFTIVFSSLTIISFLLAFFFLKNIIKNKIILLCGYLSFLYSFYLQIKLYLFSRYSINYNVFDIDTYFQYVPIRIFFILLVLFLAGFYFKNHNKISYYGCHLLSALAILWNFETGLIVFLAWLLTLIYQELYNHNFKSKIKKIAQHMLISIISFSGIIFLYSFYIYLNTKQFLDPIDFFSTIVLFLNLGLGAILLKFFHPWLILPIIYIIGLLIPIKKIVTQKKANFKTKTVLLVTLIGIGIFSYYQGRSHNYTLYGITYPAIFLLTIWADSLLKYVKRYKLNLSYNVVLFSFIFLFFIWNLFGIYSFLPNLYTFSVKPEKILAQMNTHNQDNRIYKNIEFIQKHSLEREEILIITEDYCESLYYGESKTSCPLNMPDSTSLFYKKDIKKIEDFLINNKTVKVFYNTRNKNKELLYDILKKDYIQASISPNKKLILFIPQSNM